MADPGDEDGPVEDGENYSVVADAVLPQAGKSTLEAGKGIREAGQLFSDPVQNAAGIGRVELLQVLRNGALEGDLIGQARSAFP